MGERRTLTMGNLVRVNFPYVYRDIDRHGNERYYYQRRRGAPKVRIRATPASPDFVAAYEEITASRSKRTAPTVGAAMDTWGWLVNRYLASQTFSMLDEGTQRVRRGILLSTLSEPTTPGSPSLFKDFPLSRLEPRAIRVLRDRKSKTPDAANNRLKAIRRVFVWGLENELCRNNPARDVQRLIVASDGHHVWTDDEIRQFEVHHPVGTKAHLALALLLYTGVRRSDVVRFGRQHVKAGSLIFTQRKNRARKPVTTTLPILPALRTVLERSSTGGMTFLINEHGRPFTESAFGAWFRKRCDEAGLSHCSAHGLRKAGATRVAENGATANQLMALFGWRSIREAENYTKKAERKRLARDAVHMLNRG